MAGLTQCATWLPHREFTHLLFLIFLPHSDYGREDDGILDMAPAGGGARGPQGERGRAGMAPDRDESSAKSSGSNDNSGGSSPPLKDVAKTRTQFPESWIWADLSLG